MSALVKEMLRHCQAVLVHLVTKSGIGIVLLDSGCNILDCNEGFAALFGLVEIPVGRPVSDFVSLDGAVPPFAEELILPLSKTTGLNGYLRCNFIASEGNWLLFCERLALPESKVIERMALLNSELLVMQRDMIHKNLKLDKLHHELKASREQLQKQHDELQNAFHAMEEETSTRIQAVEASRASELMLIQQNRMAAIGEMLNNLAHQWRQPLNVLGLSIQELKLSYRFGKLSQELIDGCVEKSMKMLKQLSRSIDVMMAISVPDMEMRPFRVDLTVEEVADLMKETNQGQQILLDKQSNGSISINGYRNEYIQVLLSVLINARDALQERDVAEPRIIIRCWGENGKSVVTITDNAGGIEKEVLPKVFDAYFTTKIAGKGTGINLFLSKTIIEKKMGGRLTVRNTVIGAEFRIEV